MQRKAAERQVDDLIGLDRVRGLLRTIYCRRSFLQYKAARRATSAQGRSEKFTPALRCERDAECFPMQSLPSCWRATRMERPTRNRKDDPLFGWICMAVSVNQRSLPLLKASSVRSTRLLGPKLDVAAWTALRPSWTRFADPR
jgi:hypothetical protein